MRSRFFRADVLPGRARQDPGGARVAPPRGKRLGRDADDPSRQRPLARGIHGDGVGGMRNYTVEGWQRSDSHTWRHEFERKAEALKPGEGLQTESIEGSIVLEESARLAEQAGHPADAEVLRRTSRAIYDAKPDVVMESVDDAAVQSLAARWPNRALSTTAVPIYRVVVERERAGFFLLVRILSPERRGARGQALDLPGQPGSDSLCPGHGLQRDLLSRRFIRSGCRTARARTTH